MKNNKVAVIGAGNVGSTIVYTLMMSGIASEIVLIDINKDKAEGDVLDMNHGISFVSPVKISCGDYHDCKNADIVVITAGAAQKEGETRLDLLNKNTKVFDSIIENLMPNIGENTIILVVTNPVDVLTYYTLKKSGLPSNRVIGSGTVLDTSRLKYAISEHTGIDARNVHTFVIGEHGDSEVAAFSATSIAGMSLLEYCDKCGECDTRGIHLINGLHEKVKLAAYEIIKKKGATYYAVALAVNRILEAILNNQNSILTVSTFINGQHGIHDVCLSLPCVVNKNGVDRIIDVRFSDSEIEKLRNSADIIRSQGTGNK